MTTQEALKYIFEFIEASDLQAPASEVFKAGIAIGTIQKAIEAKEQEICENHGWRLMRECPPPDRKDILVCDIDGDVYLTRQSTLDGVHRYYDAGGDKIKDIVAWMPKPEPYRERRKK